ncbi:MAG: response regulator [Thermoanaerobaculia bacterium]|nr:response regulator [Thermoanaerobaculia bacterium]
MTVSTATIGVATRKILIVDDEKQVRMITELMLTQFGFEVLTASDGLEALEVLHAESEEVGVVLMDLNMPRMSGQETYRRMRSERLDTQVVFTSGYDELELEEPDDRVVGFLRKPFSLETLLSMVRQALTRDS